MEPELERSSERRLGRAEVGLLVASLHAALWLGCDCDVRFEVTVCTCGGEHPFVRAHHVHGCRSQRLAAAPFN